MTSDGTSATPRRRPFGAEATPDGASLRVWAPERRRVSVVPEAGGERPLRRDPAGIFSAVVPGLDPGDRYRFRLDDEPTLYPDPASRFQPEGPHGPSEIVDPDGYRWRSADWPGVTLEDAVLYEMHVGTFTPEGTWDAARARLPHLAEVGVTVIEMMPVCDFSGRFGWGYDGVNLYAPTRLYGRPDDLRAFIDDAHGHGIGVILDVVYNHLGPDGNYLGCFSPHYFTTKYKTDWGEAINYDGPHSENVRRFFVQNAAYWIDEFRLDGLRLDATQSMFDDSREHIVAELAAAARQAAGSRPIILIGENEPQDTRLVRPASSGGAGLDALWNDDLHHSAVVALTGRSEAYYEDHLGTPQEFVSAAKYGFLFQGQVYAHQSKPRGRPGLDLPAKAFVTFLENHDQVANSASGARLQALSHPALLRAMTALMLLMPGTPMLFQGQEFGSTRPFFYFADHEDELRRLVKAGRGEFLEQFRSIADDAGLRARLADPGADETYQMSKLDWSEAVANTEILALHRDLLTLRREDQVLGKQCADGWDGAVIGTDALLLRAFGGERGDRLILVNLGRDFARRSLAEPLAAPVNSEGWRLIWSSEDVRYGGSGTPSPDGSEGWRLPAYSTLVMRSGEA